ncbi:MAG: hypothetical protein DSY58_06525, partial [Desulfobulbus sp.]
GYKAVAPTYPDLVVQSPIVSDTTLTTGQSFTVSATVKNQGDATSANSTLRYYRSTNSTISTGGTQLATDYVVSLAPNGLSGESATFTAPTTTGTYWIGACVDPVNGESNTENNCSSGVQFTVNNTTEGDSYEPDNSSSFAKRIRMNETQVHSIIPASDIDWVKLNFSAMQCVKIKTKGSAGDTRLWLFDSNFNKIAFNDDFEGSFSEIQVDGLTSGNYYIKVDGSQGGEISSYQLSLSSCHGGGSFPWIMFYPAITGSGR